jgi:hypothetical protein
LYFIFCMILYIECKHRLHACAWLISKN